MHPVPSPPTWKAVFLSGLLLGVLLTLLQIALLYWGSIIGIPSIVDSFVPVWYLWLFYLMLPALFGFLVTVRTANPATGYRIGRIAGITCGVLLQTATIFVAIETLANPPPLRGLASGTFFLYVLVIGLVLSLFVNALGVILATIGAFLGSRLWRRGSTTRTERSSS